MGGIDIVTAIYIQPEFVGAARKTAGVPMEDDTNE
jgi:hypothetical protein